MLLIRYRFKCLKRSGHVTNLYSSPNNFTACATQYKKVSRYRNRNSNLCFHLTYAVARLATDEENFYGIKRFSEARTLKAADKTTVRIDQRG